MKRIDLFKLLEDLDKLDNLKGVKFNFVVDNNRDIIQEQVDKMKRQTEPSQAFQDYDKERLALLQKYAEKDTSGNPKFTTQPNGLIRFDIPEKNMKKFQTEMEKLMKDYESAIQDRDKQLFEYDKFLQEDIDMNFEKMTIDDLPNDINGEQYKLVKQFILK